ncbi:MAG: RpiB/LacA/LacB family sugar-phosphate isomerase [Eubacteriales bacterium]|nr:RpiB/LacA/LacB family sugar-phosphate isomerase [Eubacteriales bacterium]
MRIALVNENSQATKNSQIFATLKKVAKPMGHTVFNYGRYSAEDSCERTYVQAGLLVAILLNAKAADLIITGCGTGEGAMIACNAFPNVTCGLVIDPCDATLAARVNDCNAISMPFAKGFGWGSELNMEYVFERLLSAEFGSGYPEEWALAEKSNKNILDKVKSVTHNDMLSIVKNIDQDFLKGAIAEKTFHKLFFANCKEGELSNYIKSVLEGK